MRQLPKITIQTLLISVTISSQAYSSQRYLPGNWLIDSPSDATILITSPDNKISCEHGMRTNIYKGMTKAQLYKIVEKHYLPNFNKAANQTGILSSSVKLLRKSEGWPRLELSAIKENGDWTYQSVAYMDGIHEYLTCETTKAELLPIDENGIELNKIIGSFSK